jgi:wyosine [tRNA(Phe)-imidazoG37] synthetase (radical SAM superfamily)
VCSIAALGKRFADTCLACQEEGDNLLALQQKRAKLEAFVRNFENNDPGYIKIRKMSEEKVRNVLYNSKDILRIAVLSVTESIRNNPDKYSALIRSKIPSTLDCNNYQYPTYYGFYMGRQPQQKLSKEEYVDILVEEADKLYYKLVKELVGQTITDYRPPNQTSSIPQSNYDLSSNRSGDRTDIYHNPTSEL